MKDIGMIIFGVEIVVCGVLFVMMTCINIARKIKCNKIDRSAYIRYRFRNVWASLGCQRLSKYERLVRKSELSDRCPACIEAENRWKDRNIIARTFLPKPICNFCPVKWTGKRCNHVDSEYMQWKREECPSKAADIAWKIYNMKWTDP